LSYGFQDRLSGANCLRIRLGGYYWLSAFASLNGQRELAIEIVGLFPDNNSDPVQFKDQRTYRLMKRAVK